MILPLFFGASLFFLICTAGLPFRISPSAGISAARFAPRSPQSLASSFRGAKSSQRFRAAICLRRLFPRRDLLPAPRKALRLRSGEQNLHRDSAPPSASGDLFRGAICSPLPAKPCGFVPGSKIFTEIPRRCVPPATPVGAVPPANAYITVGPRQQGTQAMMKKKKTADTYPS